jgi:hypothetical protein
MAATQPVRIDVSARTPQAADDVANAGEDAPSLISIAQLISNDAGGAGKQFFGVGPDHGVAAAEAKTALGAAVSVAGGDLRYDPTGVAAIQALHPGQSLADAFDYTVRLASGALSSAGIDAPIVVKRRFSLGG